MPFEIAKFAQLRPYLYHLTAAQNLTGIREQRSIAPAVHLIRRAERVELLRQRRKSHESLQVRDQVVILRDQKPLAHGNIEYLLNYTFEDLVQDLNRRVFFWPGKAQSPEPTGRGHFEHYKDEHPVIIRAEFLGLLAVNPKTEPLFCRYNSGAPRTVNRRKSPRGPDMFLPAEKFSGSVGDVIEVTFRSRSVTTDHNRVR